MSRWPGRSEAIVRPYSWRDSPTAKSQMSIISWTSPRPSERILPASRLTSAPRSSLCSREQLAEPADQRAADRRRPVRHVRNASPARVDGVVDVGGVLPADGRERLAVDRRGHRPVARDRVEVDAAAAQGVLGLGTELVGARKCHASDASAARPSGSGRHGLRPWRGRSVPHDAPWMTLGRAIAGLGVLGTAAVAYDRLVRPRLLHWGATDEEVAAPLPRCRPGPGREAGRDHGRHHRRATGPGLAVARAVGRGPGRLVLVGPPGQRRSPQRPGGAPGVAAPRPRATPCGTGPAATAPWTRGRSQRWNRNDSWGCTG